MHDRTSAHGRSRAITKKYGGNVRVNPDREHDYPEEYGGFRSSSRNRQANAKGFSDFLSPLRGAIRKSIGRPWDDVFGEFCETLDRRGLSGYHIWTHLMWEVGRILFSARMAKCMDGQHSEDIRRRWTDFTFIHLPGCSYIRSQGAFGE